MPAPDGYVIDTQCRPGDIAILPRYLGRHGSGQSWPAALLRSPFSRCWSMGTSSLVPSLPSLSGSSSV
jgi:hypothetical protein